MSKLVSSLYKLARVATKAEAIAAIREGDWTAARGNRYESEAVFGYNSEWQGPRIGLANSKKSSMIIKQGWEEVNE